MSSPDREKELETLDRLIKFCEKHDKKHAIINNEILPILFKLPMCRLKILKHSLIKDLRRKRIKHERVFRG
ncbi:MULTISPECIES: hypothetical protein [unclassified Campylobacter]|uniref:hypothetical protein n=1 Tax=unclassified Campylobacter TaxID=2593542 RepID=UPI003D33ACCA